MRRVITDKEIKRERNTTSEKSTAMRIRARIRLRLFQTTAEGHTSPVTKADYLALVRYRNLVEKVGFLSPSRG